MAGLPANITNFVKQEIRVAKTKPLLPVFEAVSNAIDSIGERNGGGTIRVTVVRHPDSAFDRSRGDPHAFFVEDDGVGFTDANMAGFDQLYTDRKQLKGGKGRGRFAYLKVFDRVEINSKYLDEGGKLKQRRFEFDLAYSGNLAKPAAASGGPATFVRLYGMWLELNPFRLHRSRLR